MVSLITSCEQPNQLIISPQCGKFTRNLFLRSMNTNKTLKRHVR